MLPDIRKRVGLGYSPGRFCTNDAEAGHHMLKTFFDWNKSSWEKCSSVLDRFVLQSENELKRAIYGEGDYRVSDKYKKMGVNPIVWSFNVGNMYLIPVLYRNPMFEHKKTKRTARCIFTAYQA